MKGLAGRLAAAALLAAAAPAAAAQLADGAQPLAPSDGGEIVSAIRSCADALSRERLDLDRLARDGWAPAQMQAADGSALDSPLSIYGRGSVMLLVAPPAADRLPSCMLVGRLPADPSAPALLAFLAQSFGPSAQASEAGGIWRLPGGRLMDVARTGTAEAPAFRIIVGQSRSAQPEGGE